MELQRIINHLNKKELKQLKIKDAKDGINEIVKQPTHKTARVMPDTSLSRQEERLTSIVLGVIRIVPEFAEILMSTIGERVGKRSKIDCFIELMLHKDFNSKKAHERPDGLLVHRNGSKTWICLIEAKAGNDKLDVDQINRYLQLAERISSSKKGEAKIDALLTITNDFVAIPEHHPLADQNIDKRLKRKFKLVHWSWTFIQTQAELLLNNRDFIDPTKRALIEELVQYMG